MCRTTLCPLSSHSRLLQNIQSTLRCEESRLGESNDVPNLNNCSATSFTCIFRLFFAARVECLVGVKPDVSFVDIRIVRFDVLFCHEDNFNINTVVNPHL